MPALPPKADICSALAHMSAKCQKQTFVESGVIALAADSFQGLASTALA